MIKPRLLCSAVGSIISEQNEWVRVIPKYRYSRKLPKQLRNIFLLVFKLEILDIHGNPYKGFPIFAMSQHNYLPDKQLNLFSLFREEQTHRDFDFI